MQVGNINLSLSQYYSYSTNRFEIYLSGDIYDLDDTSTVNSSGESIGPYLESLAKAMTSGKIDFENVYGYFRIAINDKETGSQYFFTDNLGSQIFYIDEIASKVSDSFLELINGIGSERLDFKGVAQIFAYDATVDSTTIVKGIKKTDSESWYEVRDGKISKYSKGLKRFCDRYTGHDLYDFVSAECAIHKDRPTAVRVTGGTDSRAILASALRAGTKPEIIISGHAGNPDIPISRKIANTAGLELVVLDSDEHEDGWIEKSYDYFDGCFDPVLGYRQMMIVKTLKHGTDLLLGGVGGEFYKNYYIKPFLYRLIFRKASVDEVISRVFDHKAGGYSWLSDEIKEQTGSLKNHILDCFKKELEKEENQLSVFNHAGYYLMRSTFANITNALSRDMTQADPLVDPRLIRSIADKNPFFLSMAIWQRKQIHRDYPSLSDIETDQGYTMTVDPIRLTGERIKKGIFWASRVVERVRKKLGLKWKDITFKYWDLDYSSARESDVWKRCLLICKDYGIINKNATEEELPLNVSGYIIMLGMSIEQMNH